MLGFTSKLALLPELQAGFFVTTNRDWEAGGGDVEITGAVGEVIVEELLGALEDAPLTRPEGAGAELEEYAGNYVNGVYCRTCSDAEFEMGGWRMRWPQSVQADGEALVFNEARYLPAGDDVFVREDGLQRISFGRGGGPAGRLPGRIRRPGNPGADPLADSSSTDSGRLAGVFTDGHTDSIGPAGGTQLVASPQSLGQREIPVARALEDRRHAGDRLRAGGVFHHACVDRSGFLVNAEQLGQNVSQHLETPKDAFRNALSLLGHGDDPVSLVLDQVHLLQGLEHAGYGSRIDSEAPGQVAHPGHSVVTADAVEHLEIHLLGWRDGLLSMQWGVPPNAP